ncbi:MAG: glycosyltransferase family 2 protein [Lachnospiraceae bacterium]|nr:glycosyltransferase family 2 protein [Lachnospiraceae bacterium]
MDYKVSIIIPMYNAREYIRENVDSLLKQTLSEIEIVIVNDCSPDDSMEICRSAYGSNERVRLIDQPSNMGPGEARNRGIREARGEYIAFVDSDDAVLPDGFEKMYKVAKDEDADVLHCTGAIYPLVKNPPVNLLDVDEKDLAKLPLDRYDIATEVRTVSSNPIERFKNWKNEAYHWNVWNKLYRRTFLLDNDLYFGNMRVAEDQVFCFGCLIYAGNYVQMPGEFYLYRISGDSLSRSGNRISLLTKALRASIDSEPVIRKLMEGVPAFAYRQDLIREAVWFVTDCLEKIFIRPVFQEIGEQGIIEDEGVKEIFTEYFGQSADYVFYDFIEQHRNYPPVEDMLKLISDIDYLKENVAKFGKKAVSD